MKLLQCKRLNEVATVCRLGGYSCLLSVRHWEACTLLYAARSTDV